MNGLELTPEMFCSVFCKYNKQTTNFFCPVSGFTVKFGLKNCKEGDEELIEETE